MEESLLHAIINPNRKESLIREYKRIGILSEIAKNPEITKGFLNLVIFSCGDASCAILRILDIPPSNHIVSDADRFLRILGLRSRIQIIMSLVESSRINAKVLRSSITEASALLLPDEINTTINLSDLRSDLQDFYTKFSSLSSYLSTDDNSMICAQLSSMLDIVSFHVLEHHKSLRLVISKVFIEQPNILDTYHTTTNHKRLHQNRNVICPPKTCRCSVLNPICGFCSFRTYLDSNNLKSMMEEQYACNESNSLLFIEKFYSFACDRTYSEISNTDVIYIVSLKYWEIFHHYCLVIVDIIADLLSAQTSPDVGSTMMYSLSSFVHNFIIKAKFTQRLNDLASEAHIPANLSVDVSNPADADFQVMKAIYFILSISMQLLLANDVDCHSNFELMSHTSGLVCFLPLSEDVMTAFHDAVHMFIVKPFFDQIFCNREKTLVIFQNNLFEKWLKYLLTCSYNGSNMRDFILPQEKLCWLYGNDLQNEPDIDVGNYCKGLSAVMSALSCHPKLLLACRAVQVAIQSSFDAGKVPTLLALRKLCTVLSPCAEVCLVSLVSALASTIAEGSRLGMGAGSTCLSTGHENERDHSSAQVAEHEWKLDDTHRIILDTTLVVVHEGGKSLSWLLDGCVRGHKTYWRSFEPVISIEELASDATSSFLVAAVVLVALSSKDFHSEAEMWVECLLGSDPVSAMRTLQSCAVILVNPKCDDFVTENMMLPIRNLIVNASRTQRNKSSTHPARAFTASIAEYLLTGVSAASNRRSIRRSPQSRTVTSSPEIPIADIKTAEAKIFALLLQTGRSRSGNSLIADVLSETFICGSHCTYYIVNRLVCSSFRLCSDSAISLISRPKEHLLGCFIKGWGTSVQTHAIVQGRVAEEPSFLRCPLEHEVEGDEFPLDVTVSMIEVSALRLQSMLAVRSEHLGSVLLPSTVCNTFACIHALRCHTMTKSRNRTSTLFMNVETIFESDIQDVLRSCRHSLVVPALSSAVRWYMRQLVVGDDNAPHDVLVIYVLTCFAITRCLGEQSRFDFVCDVVDTSMFDEFFHFIISNHRNESKMNIIAHIFIQLASLVSGQVMECLEDSQLHIIRLMPMLALIQVFRSLHIASDVVDTSECRIIVESLQPHLHQLVTHFQTENDSKGTLTCRANVACELASNTKPKSSVLELLLYLEGVFPEFAYLLELIDTNVFLGKDVRINWKLSLAEKMTENGAERSVSTVPHSNKYLLKAKEWVLIPSFGSLWEACGPTEGMNANSPTSKSNACSSNCAFDSPCEHTSDRERLFRVSWLQVSCRLLHSDVYVYTEFNGNMLAMACALASRFFLALANEKTVPKSVSADVRRATTCRTDTYNFILVIIIDCLKHASLSACYTGTSVEGFRCPALEVVRGIYDLVKDSSAPDLIALRIHFIIKLLNDIPEEYVVLQSSVIKLHGNGYSSQSPLNSSGFPAISQWEQVSAYLQDCLGLTSHILADLDTCGSNSCHTCEPVELLRCHSLLMLSLMSVLYTRDALLASRRPPSITEDDQSGLSEFGLGSGQLWSATVQELRRRTTHLGSKKLSGNERAQCFQHLRICGKQVGWEKHWVEAMLQNINSQTTLEIARSAEGFCVGNDFCTLPSNFISPKQSWKTVGVLDKFVSPAEKCLSTEAHGNTLSAPDETITPPVRRHGCSTDFSSEMRHEGRNDDDDDDDDDVPDAPEFSDDEKGVACTDMALCNALDIIVDNNATVMGSSPPAQDTAACERWGDATQVEKLFRVAF